MFIIAFAVFLLFLIADAALSAAVIYHLRQYTMPDWNAARIAVPAYIALAALFAILAMYELWNLPLAGLTFEGALPDFKTLLPPVR